MTCGDGKLIRQRCISDISNNRPKIMKSTVVNLTGKDIDKDVTSLLNLGTNFVPTLELMQLMKLIATTES